MDAPTFAAFIAQERTRLQDAIKAAKAKRQQAEHEIEQLESELTAIAAYDAARKKTTKPRAARGRRGEKREAIRSLIAEHRDGLTRAQLLTAMEAHGDKAAEQSISNALAALKKAGRVTQEGKTHRVREQ
jgi:hypothetical protein